MKLTKSRIDLTDPRAAGYTTWQDRDHVIVVTQKGSIVAVDLAGNTCFEKELPASIQEDQLLDVHCYGKFTAVVESRGLNGIVFRLDQPDWQMEISRKDYQCKHCTWPIGFFERNDMVHLIHATQWNRLDIACLENGQCLTEREIDAKSNLNYLDFFHSRLHMSPDRKHFISNGWVWSPWDVLYCWSVDKFLKEFESGHVSLDALERNGYNWDRPCCFVDNETIAWGYNELEAHVPGTPTDQPTELIFQKIHTKEIARRMVFEHFDLSGENEAYGWLWFDRQEDLFVCSSNRLPTTELKAPTRGTTITDATGKELWRSPETAEFVSTQKQIIGFLADNKIELVQYGTG